MKVSGEGHFTLSLDSDVLSKALRPNQYTPRNSKYLIECRGAVGLDGVLRMLDALEDSKIDTDVIADGFPYPQIFIFPTITIVCGQTKIYEWTGLSIQLKLTVSQAGNRWSAIHFFDYVYMSNGAVAVVRNAEDGIFEETSEQPVATAIENYNGQVLIGTAS